MKLSASQAAKRVGKSVPTITRAIKSGKMSAIPREGGGWIVETSELFRVWPAVSLESDVTSNKLEYETPSETRLLQAEVKVLQEKIEALKYERERECSLLSDTIQDLRTRLDTESVERRLLTAQVTDQREKTSGSARRFWKLLKR